MNPRDLPIEVWEALCRRCGKCCTEKVEVDGKIYITKKYCRFLDPETKLCRVYENRFEAEPGCVDVPAGIKMGVFPADCPYVADIRKYQAAIEVWDDPAIDEAIRELIGEDAL
ncbi:MAG: hypothetical protein H6807_13310 [Planctomycetes bacterium]|nr:hypothetical protein [Planctomycetota bacterium]